MPGPDASNCATSLFPCSVSSPLFKAAFPKFLGLDAVFKKRIAF
jgi:hypothetical protein